MLINFSNNPIYVSNWKNEFYIENKNIEEELPKKLNNIEINSSIYAINWPWSFTAIRTWTLCINLYKFLSKEKSNIYTCSKIDIYKYLYEKYNLFNIIYVFIWQKNNCWEFDAKTNKITKVKIDEHKLNSSFSDFGENKIDIKYYKNEIIARVNWEIYPIEKNIFSYKDILEANYMINVNIN